LQASVGIKTKQNSMQKQKPKVFNKFQNSRKINQQKKKKKPTQALLGKPTAEKLTNKK
jgi:hypothetical protein